MRYYSWVLLGVLVLAIFVLLICLLVHLRKKWACKKVQSICQKEKIRDLDDALAPFGFCYEQTCDVITCGMYPWQREMGYCRQYDEAAPIMNMVFECEPIYFDYEGKHWLLELWKGQYGCCAGAEIGLYVNEEEGQKTPESRFYQCVSDENRLFMHFVLYYNGAVLMERKGLHWWLTGFCPGKYVKAQELAMEICIHFPTYPMRQAFCRGLLRAGYSVSEFKAVQNCVTLLFQQPKTKQPSYCKKWYIHWVSWKNRRNCRRFCKLTKCFTSILDKITYLCYCFPRLYHVLICMGMKCNKKKMCKWKKRHVSNFKKKEKNLTCCQWIPEEKDINKTEGNKEGSKIEDYGLCSQCILGENCNRNTVEEDIQNNGKELK